MNKKLTIFAAFLIIAFAVFVIADDFSGTTKVAGLNNSFHNTDLALFTTNVVAQSFTPIGANATYDITNVNYTMKRKGTCSGDMLVRIFNTTSGNEIPSGPTLSEGTLTMSTIATGGSVQDVHVNMTSTSNLVNNSRYVVVIYTNGCPDGSNAIVFNHTNTGNPYIGGNFSFDFGNNGTTWTTTVAQDMIFGIFSGGTFVAVDDLEVTLTEPTTGASLSTTTSQNFSADFSTGGGVNLTNATYIIFNSSGGVFNTTAQIVLGKTNSTTQKFSNIPTGEYEWNVLGCGINATSTICNFAPVNFSFVSVPFEVTSETFDKSVFETDEEMFELNITTSSSIVDIAASLNYNGTLFSASSTCDGTSCSITRTIDIPLTTGVNENKTFNWQVALFDGVSEVSLTFNTTTQQQNVTPINFGPCGSKVFTPSVNFTTFTETNVSKPLNVDFRATFAYFLGTGTVKKFNSTDPLALDNEFGFCLDNNLTYKVNSQVEIAASGFAQRSFDFVARNYTNSFQTQRLFLLNTSAASTTIVEVKDQGLVEKPGILVNISRFYPGLGEFIQVESSVTDTFGKFAAKLIRNDVNYKAEFFDSSGKLLKVIDNIIVTCTTTICSLPFVLEGESSEFDDFQEFEDYSRTLSFNNVTNTFIYSWADTTGDSTITRLKVTRTTLNGTSVVCNITSDSSLATLTCAVGSTQASYSAQAFRTPTTGEFSGLERLIELKSVKVGDPYSTYGKEGLFWVFILLMSMLAVGAFNPTVGALLFGIGFIMFGVLGIISAPIGVTIGFIVIVGLFIWVIKT